MSIYKTEYKNFGAALSKLMQERGLKNSWLAKEATNTYKESRGFASMLSRYVHNNNIPADQTLKKIGSILSVEFKQNAEGKWEIKDLSEQVNEVEVRYNPLPDFKKLNRAVKQLEDAIDGYKKTARAKNFSEEEKAELVALFKLKVKRIASEL